MILGRGGAGKSTLAAALGTATGLPVIELDKHFWGPDLEATPPDRWAVVQGELAITDRWIMDGDLGPYDVLDVRLRRAGTVLLLDHSFPRCAWRALLINAIAAHAGHATLHVLRNPRAKARFVARELTRRT
ncbi:adenylate kinase family enzyme [Lentzea atacamensis]|uniref:Adenylate kinase family enzyme n=1 Tax=Lentzea atacamensis TaxID=531938 RepID=A0ABX9E268_9PSEU|nr:adenylate kinase family enzyme [Lentzea atacamensis]